jgi:hypothetical protein
VVRPRASVPAACGGCYASRCSACAPNVQRPAVEISGVDALTEAEALPVDSFFGWGSLQPWQANASEVLGGGRIPRVAWTIECWDDSGRWLMKG